ncbi:MAG: hypothetical protein WCQ72_04910 [Eubacteriales bacterium]
MHNVENASEISCVSIKLSLGGADHTLMYNLIKNSRDSAGPANDIFSVFSVLSKDDDPGDFVTGFVYDIARSHDTAQTMFQLLVRNEVLPAQLSEAVCDLLSV